MLHLCARRGWQRQITRRQPVQDLGRSVTMDQFSVERIPLPRFSTYVFYTLASLSGSVTRACYYYFSEESNNRAFTFQSIAEDTWLFWSLINFAYCLLICAGRQMQHLFFGELRDAENAHVRENLSNFIFYKVVFVYGILNAEALHELLLWASWFSVLGFLHLFVGLVRDRSEFIVQSSQMPFVQPRMLYLLASALILGNLLMAVSVAVGARYSWNFMFFMLAEVFQLVLRSVHVVIWYGVQLYCEALSRSKHVDVSYRKSLLIYYTEVIFSSISDFGDVIHYVHLLIWNNVRINMSGIIVGMHLQHLYFKLSKRYQSHRRHQDILYFLQFKCLHINKSDQRCVICWGKLSSALQLPCKHLFHLHCLHVWIERIASCPVCRCPLQLDNPEPIDTATETSDFGDLSQSVSTPRPVEHVQSSGQHATGPMTECDSCSLRNRLACAQRDSYEALTTDPFLSEQNTNVPSAMFSIHSLLKFSNQAIASGAPLSGNTAVPGKLFASLEQELMQYFPSNDSDTSTTSLHVTSTPHEGTSNASIHSLDPSVSMSSGDDCASADHVIRLIIRHLASRIVSALTSAPLKVSYSSLHAGSDSSCSPSESESDTTFDRVSVSTVCNSTIQETSAPFHETPALTTTNPFPYSPQKRAALLNKRKMLLKQYAKSAFVKKLSTS